MVGGVSLYRRAGILGAFEVVDARSGDARAQVSFSSDRIQRLFSGADLESGEAALRTLGRRRVPLTCDLVSAPSFGRAVCVYVADVLAAHLQVNFRYKRNRNSQQEQAISSARKHEHDLYILPGFSVS